MQHHELFYRLALCLVSGIGPVKYKKLISLFGSAENTFGQTLKSLNRCGILSENNAASIHSFRDFAIAEKELKYVETHGIHISCFDDNTYPERLSACTDSPVLLFHKGSANLNHARILSVIGTRAFTEYGRKVCEELTEQLKPYQVMIVSGLAYGIDVIAHKACIRHGIPTAGVLAHGLNMVYPAAHTAVAKEMLQQGALISEYFSGAALEKQNFPTRNRIVAGLSDATIVIETDIRGGSMITADIAFSYNREVFCFPGRSIDNKSAGCNKLIKTLKGQLVTGADDIARELGWKSAVKKKPVQKELFIEMTDEEKNIITILREKQQIHIDELLIISELSSSQVAGAMLSLEMQNIIQVMPGKIISLS